MIVVFIVTSCGIKFTINGIEKDDTDSLDGHSGLLIFTVHKTGCQYLYVYRVGLRPRLNSEGKQFCKDK